MELDNEYRPLLDAPPPQNYQPNCRRRLWQISVLMSSFLSVMASSGFNYGIAGAITEQMTHRFGVSVSESSWTSSVHTAVFFFTCMYAVTDSVQLLCTCNHEKNHACIELHVQVKIHWHENQDDTYKQMCFAQGTKYGIICLYL